MLVLYKVMIRKGREGMYNKSEPRREGNDSMDNDNATKQKMKIRNKIVNNNVFSQSTKQHEKEFNLTPPHLAENSAQGVELALSENKQNKIDENFVKNKYDSMCSLPVKTKFIFYNVNQNQFNPVPIESGNSNNDSNHEVEHHFE